MSENQPEIECPQFEDVNVTTATRLGDVFVAGDGDDITDATNLLVENALKSLASETFAGGN